MGTATSAAETHPLTFLFTDIVGSTEMLTMLGEHVWLDALRKHDGLVQDAVDGRGGRRLKFLGDGWMVTFVSPEPAIDAATAIQRRIAADPSPQGFRLRIGVHAGKAIATGDDYVGKDVVLASRITNEAGAGEILASADVVHALGHVDVRFDGGRIAHLKGLGPHLVFGVDWTPSDNDGDPRRAHALPPRA